MKLFLVSQWLLPEFRLAFEQLVGKPLSQTSVVLIENGADDEPYERSWVKNTRNSLLDAGMTVTQLDLRSYAGGKDNERLRTVLSDADVIWVGGGNAFYLNWILEDSGARDLIVRMVKDGKIYAGGSAGAIVAGPTISGFETADDVSFAPKLVVDGMALTDIVVLPHWGGEHYGAIMERIAKQLATTGRLVQPLTDREALIVDGVSRRVITA